MAAAKRVKAYLEIGNKRVFAGAVDWPGWSRSARDEDAALEALVAYGNRYRRALGSLSRKLELTVPPDVSHVTVVEKVGGDATTDFGAPGAGPARDDRGLTEAELERQTAILRACWSAFDGAVAAAGGRALRKGPRGGGRQLQAIVRHVLDADAGYLRRIGRSHPKADPTESTAQEMVRVRREVLDGVTSLASGEPLEEPLRSGTHWTPRYMIRRAAWHSLDHAWEIEDRAT